MAKPRSAVGADLRAGTGTDEAALREQQIQHAVDATALKAMRLCRESAVTPGSTRGAVAIRAVDACGCPLRATAPRRRCRTTLPEDGRHTPARAGGARR